MLEKKKLRVLFIGHDLTYVDFYASLQIDLSSRFQIESDYVFFRPGAAIYGRLAYGLNAISPYFARKHHRSQKNKELQIDNTFYEPLDKKTRQRIQALASQYETFLKKKLNAYYDLIISSGEYRLGEQIVSLLYSGNASMATLFFEAGPPGFIYFSPFGTNANAQFQSLNFLHGCQSARDVDRSEMPPDKAGLRKACLAIDLLLILFGYFVLKKSDLKEYVIGFDNKIKGIFKRWKYSRNSPQLPDRINSARKLLFLGQVKHDVNHTHFGASDENIFSTLAELLRHDTSIIVYWRDHPLEKKHHIVDNLSELFPGRIFLTESKSLQEDLSNCVATVCVNSNGAIESLQAGKPVFILGRSYYETLPGVFSNSSSFLKALHQNLFEESSIKAAINIWLDRYFLPINYRGSDFSNISRASDFIETFLRRKQTT